MLDVPYLPPALPGGDRSGRFIAAGVILLLIALLGGCFTGLIPVSFLMQQRLGAMAAQANNGPHAGRGNAAMTSTMRPVHGMPLSQAVAATGMYLGVTVVCAWLGIAGLLKRRYVRPLVIIFSTHAVILGVCVIVMFAALMPVLVDQMNQSAPGAAGIAVVGFVIGVLLMAVLLIGVPLALLVLMKPDAVRVTAEHFDLRRRWTDGVPLKLLGLIVTLGVFALFDLVTLNQRGLPMVFTNVTGPAFVVALVAHAALIASAAVLVYRRNLLGWRLAFYGILVPMLAFTVSSVTLPTAKYLELTANQPDAAEMIERHETLFRAFGTGFAVVFLVTFVVYMLRMRALVEVPVAGLGSE